MLLESAREMRMAGEACLESSIRESQRAFVHELFGLIKSNTQNNGWLRSR